MNRNRAFGSTVKSIRIARFWLLATTLFFTGCAAPSDHPPEEMMAASTAKSSSAAGAAGRTRAPRPAGASTVNTDPARNREHENSSIALVYPSGEKESGVILMEKRFPSQARLAQIYHYELKVTNLTDWPVSGVVVREDFPPSFAVLDVQPSPATAPAASTEPASQPSPVSDGGGNVNSAAGPSPAGEASDIRYVQGVGYVRDVAGTWWATANHAERRGVIAREFIIGVLEAHQSRVIPVAGRSNDLGKLDTRTTVTYTPVLAGGTDVINPILKLAKEGPRNADLCDTIEYRYVISNVGVGTETDVHIDETLPDGLTTADGQSKVSIAVGDLPEKQSKPFVVQIKAARTGEYASRAAAKGFGTTAMSPEVVTAIHAPKLTVAMTGPASEYVGKSATYEFTVTNSGDAAARHATVSAAAEAGVEVSLPGAPVASVQALGTIDPGQSRKVQIAAKPSVGGTMNIRATAQSDCAAPAAATSHTAVLVIPSLVMEVTDHDDPVRVGEATAYTITVRNIGSGPDKDVRIVAELPEKLTFMQTTGPTPGKLDGQRVIFESLPKLDPGQSVSWQVQVKAADAGDVRFKVEMTSESLKEPVVGTQSTKLY